MHENRMNIGDFYGLAVWQNWGPKKTQETPETPNPVWPGRPHHCTHRPGPGAR